MYLIENPHLVVKYLVYILAVWFFISVLAKGIRGNLSSVIIFLFMIVQLIMYKENNQLYGSVEYFNEYKDELWVWIRLSGLTALALTMIFWRDDAAWKQALILAFATFVHNMVLLDLTITSNWFSLFFYNYYDELIIIVGLLQLWVSKNGMVNGINNLFRKASRGYLWLHIRWDGGIQSLNIYFRQKKSEKGN